jgi:uncharacterized protein YndB with AHSA1/START domain
MRRQHIEIRQRFNAPVEEIFRVLTDHESFGEVVGANIRRVVDSPGENKNGVGSVRRISSFPVPAFEETVITYEPNQLMEYVVSRGSPIKNHTGRMQFSEEQGKTTLFYTIEFEPRMPFLFLGSVIKQAVDKPIRRGIARLAERVSASS